MQKEYIGGINSTTEYSLSTGTIIELNKEELEELYYGSHFGEEIEAIKNQNQKLSIKNEYYKELLQSFNSIINKIGEIK